jgi:lipopolysaccharide transport system permease protein
VLGYTRLRPVRLEVSAPTPTSVSTPHTAADAHAGEQVLWIHASGGLRFLDLGELWAFRELLFYFAWRDVKVRYKQSVVGVGWILIQPLAQMFIFAAIFGRIVGLPSEGVPYATFALSGLAVWTYFASSVTKMSSSLDGNIHLITKVYFPRIVLPVSVMLGTLVDFSIVLPIVLILGAVAHGGLLGSWLVLPLVMLLLLAVTFGVGIWLSALNARYRDVMLTLPIVLQIGFYLTPVVLAASIITSVVTEPWLPILALINPMFGVVELFRWAALGTSAPEPTTVMMSCVSAAVLVASGGMFFARTQRTIVDRV